MTSPEQLTSQVHQPVLRREIALLIALLLILVGLEIALRTTEAQLSGNLNHIKEELPAIGQLPSRVLFIGNSLTNNAVDPARVAQALYPQADPASVQKMTPDSTALSDWFCIYQNAVQNGPDPQTPPKIIVIGFAWAQLSDQYPVNAARLGAFLCRPADLGPLSVTALSEHENFLAFFAGSASHVFVNREAIRHRLLDLIVPKYKDVTQALNRNPGANAEATAAPHYSYQLLTTLAQRVQQAGSQLYLVAMPVQSPYPLDPALLETVRGLNLKLFDMRQVQGIDLDMYEDSIHLNRTGQQRFSTAIAQRLATAIHP